MLHRDLVGQRQFAFPNSEQRLILTASVLEVFTKFRQLHSEPESGGLLFAEFDLPVIRVTQATPPNRTDKRWKTLFIPNRFLQRQLIKSNFKKGLHFIGEWHTHPEPRPAPSPMDNESMRDAFLKSRHNLNCFVAIIVGNDPKLLELWIGTHNGSRVKTLEELHAKYWQ